MKPVIAVLAALLFAPQARAAVSASSAEYQQELQHVSQQLIALAEAIPEDKYGWRPGDGVRSFAEVFMHAAAGNYLLLAQIGIRPPDNLELGAAGTKRPEKKFTSKTEVVNWLKRSLDAVQANHAIADMERRVDFWGKPSSVRAVYLRILVHLNEHMGQAVAYARMNGIVPPWSATE
jgi:uncharacterized damage-inducible protein DinB